MKIFITISIVLLFASSSYGQLSDTSTSIHYKAHWLSLGIGYGQFTRSGLSLMGSYSFELERINFGFRTSYYHSLSGPGLVIDGPQLPYPKDYLFDFAILLGVSVNKSVNGHTTISFGPTFAAGSILNSSPFPYRQAPFSNGGITFDFAHQFIDASGLDISGFGVRFFITKFLYRNNWTNSSFFVIQLTSRFGTFLK